MASFFDARPAKYPVLSPLGDYVRRHPGQARADEEATYWLGVHCQSIFEPTTAQKMRAWNKNHMACRL